MHILCQKTTTSHLLHDSNTAARSIDPSILQLESFSWVRTSLFSSSPEYRHRHCNWSRFRLLRHQPYQSPLKRPTPQDSAVKQEVSPLVALTITMVAAALFEDGTIVLGASISWQR